MKLETILTFFWPHVCEFSYISLYGLDLCFSYGPLLQEIQKKEMKIKLVC